MRQRNIISIPLREANLFYRPIISSCNPRPFFSGNIHAAMKTKLFGNRMDPVSIGRGHPALYRPDHWYAHDTGGKGGT